MGADMACWKCFLYSQKALSISHILLGNFPIFSKCAQYFSHRWIIFLYSQKAFMNISPMLGIFFFILKRCSVYFTCLVFFLYSEKALSISHMFGNFAMFSKGAQYFLYQYRWVIFLYSPKAPSISYTSIGG